jgi:hypothetical protein
MFRKELIIGVLATSVILGSFGTALAEDSNDKSILGTDEFSFESSETAADVAARNYVYDQEQLDLIGTEAGGEIASTPQALRAARDHDYNKEQLAVVGTEAGDWEFQSYDQGSESNEAVADKRAVTHGDS